MAPAPEVSCRTRRETKLTRMLGLPTFAKACLQNSLFKGLYIFRASQSSGYSGDINRKVKVKFRPVPACRRKTGFLMLLRSLLIL